MGWFEDQGFGASQGAPQGQPPLNALAPQPSAGGVAGPALPGAAMANGDDTTRRNDNDTHASPLEESIRQAYRDYLGREASDREIASYGNLTPQRVSQIIQGVINSPEGQKYKITKTQNRLKSFYQELMGRDPTQAELDGWGTDIDENYFNAIRQKLAQSQEAIDYQKNGGKPPNAPAPPTTGGGGGSGGGGAPDMAAIEAKLRSGDHDTIIQGLRELAAAKGSHPKESSYETWANYILNGNGESKDSDYFIKRVMNDDPEFGGRGGGGSYIDPWTGKYDPPKYEKPPPFVAPDPALVLDDPAIKLQMQESLKALQRSALSRGTLLTGGTATDIDQMAQQVASAGYDKIYGRAVAEDQVKYGRSLDEYGIARDNALATYSDRKGTFYDNQDRPFDKLLKLAGLGGNALGQANAQNASAASNYGNALANGTNTSNGYATAVAAAPRAAPNAWANAFGQGAANAGNAYNVYRNGQNSLSR